MIIRRDRTKSVKLRSALRVIIELRPTVDFRGLKYLFHTRYSENYLEIWIRNILVDADMKIYLNYSVNYSCSFDYRYIGSLSGEKELLWTSVCASGEVLSIIGAL